MQGVKLRRIIVRVFFRPKHPPIIVASTGRAGSTYLYLEIANSIASSFRLEKLLNVVGLSIRGLFLDEAFALSEATFLYNRVYKTHDLANKDYFSGARVIFIYSDPIDSLLSVERRVQREKDGVNWFYKHVYHLSGIPNWAKRSEIDVLNYKNCLSTYLSIEGANLFVIDYADLGEKINELFSFLNLEFQERIKLEIRDQRSLPRSKYESGLREFYLSKK